MYDKVQKHWIAERQRIETEIASHAEFPPLGREIQSTTTQAEVTELHRRLGILKSTDMAVIVSPGQNEIDQMAKLGLDIVAHRKRMNDEQLDEKFKDPKDDLRIAFVCAMWLTGFDAQSCSTIYLDNR